MPSPQFEGAPAAARRGADTAVLVGIACLIAIAHLLTNGGYGFHRDEFQFLSDARHLDWGFVAYPPVTPVLERIGLHLFGVSLVGLRLFSVIAQSVAIVVTGLIARELGGRRLAQVAAALSVALSALPLFEGTEFQYTSFDYLWWVLIAYFVVRLLKSEDPRWWLAVGASIGVALETKYSVLFFITGLLSAFLLTSSRKYFASWYFAAGVGVALLIFLPNFLWQAHHGFISYHFLQHIHKRDVRQGRADGFLLQQLWICTNSFTVPMWIAGAMACFRSKRYRAVGWMFAITLAMFFFGKGRAYYVAGAYPMLMAMGAVTAERWLAGLSRGWRLSLEIIYFTGLVACGLLFCAILLPLASSGPLMQFALKNNGDLREEIGWPELVKTVAAIRDTLPPDQRAGVGVIVGNYGEQGAIEILGPQYGLPIPLSGTNSAWLRGYPTPQPTTLITIGLPQSDVDRMFSGCRLAGHNGNSLGIKNEESTSDPDLFVCGPPLKPWPEFWKDFQSFG